MVTVNFSELLQLAASEAGLDSTNLGTTQFAQFRSWIAKRLRPGYEWGLWTDLLRWEKRYFRALYASATTYQYGTEVYFPQTQAYYHAVRTGGFSAQAPANSLDVLNAAYWAIAQPSYTAVNYSSTTVYAIGDQVYYPINDTFYQALTASTGTLPTAGVTAWGILIPFNRFIDWDQAGHTAIGTVLRVRTADERYSKDAQPVNWFPSADGVQVIDSYPWVHLRFRVRAPLLKGDAYDDTVIYPADSQVYFIAATTPGNFYDCVTTTAAGESPADTAAKWSIVDIPDFLMLYLSSAAVADFLRSDGQNTKALAQEGVAIEHLSNQTMKLSQGENYERPLVYTR